ncbi:MAG: sugar phosphate isomerase/epimerase [Planctomycetes bacterium]|nr:sugar phosphate isomerase/epimerase [Planctomycetota bacterium]
MAKIPIGLQLYSVRENCKADLPATLEAVAGMGYDGVEFAGYYDYSAADLRRLLDDVGLKCCGTHTGFATLVGDELKKTAEYNAVLGNRFLICPSLPAERRADLQAWVDTAHVFNDMAAAAADLGAVVGYHNHNIEFTPENGTTPWDAFFSNTVDEVVMQLDTGNCLHGNGDSVAVLEKFPGRAVTLHLKEFSSSNDKALIGEGDIPWARIFELAESTGGTGWYIVEQESYACPPLECVAKCLENLHRMGK